MLNVHDTEIGVNGFPGSASANPGSSGQTNKPKDGSRQSPKNVFGSRAVETLIEMGYSPIAGRWKPTCHKDENGKWVEHEPKTGKAPLEKGWSEFCARVMTPEEIAKARKPVGRTKPANHLPQIHVAMGFNNVIALDVDTDCPFVNKIFDDVIGRSPVARIGGKGHAGFYWAGDEIIESAKWYGKNDDGSKSEGPIIEVMSVGCNVRIPPSSHPTNASGVYSWVDEKHKLYNTPIDELPRITAAQIAELKRRLTEVGQLYVKPQSERTGPRKTVKKETLTEQLHKRYTAKAEKMLDILMGELASMNGKGGRNAALNLAVFKLGVYVHHGYISEARLFAEAESACKTNGLIAANGIDDVRDTINDALDASSKHELEELEDRPFEGKQAFDDSWLDQDQAELAREFEKAWKADQQAREAPKAEGADTPPPPPGEEPKTSDGDGGGEPPPRIMKWPDLTDSGGIVKRSQRNVAAYLKFAGIICAYNDFAQRPVILRNGREEVVDDIIMRELWLHADILGMQAHEGYFQSVILNFCAKNRFNPVTTWLDSLEWDGVPRIDRWTQDYLGMEATELYCVQGAIQLIAAVRRARHPGTKHDALPVLEGPQGGGKSTAILILAGGGKLFTDGLNIGDDPKVIIEQTADAWHVELAELAGMGRREVESVKSFISRQHDSARLSYDRANTRRPRNFVMWATTNDDEYLIDPTGNRRFWPWKVGTIDLEGLKRDREQLWAEAAHREKAGESIALPERLYAAAAEEQKARVQIDPWQQTLEDAIRDRWGKIMVTDIWRKLDVDSKSQNPMLGKRIANIMKLLGYKKDKQRDYRDKPVNCYSKAGPNGETGKAAPWLDLWS